MANFWRPLTMEEVLLISQYMRQWRTGYISIGIRSINGLRNPRLAEVGTESAKFDRVVHLWHQLRRARVLSMARDPDGELEAVFSLDHGEHDKLVTELLELTGIGKRPAGGRLVLPVRVAAEKSSEETLAFETLSVLGVLRSAGDCIEIPEPHLEAGVVEPREDNTKGRFMRIRTSRSRPRGEGTVAIRYRNWWYYVDDADPESKRAFLLLRMLVGLRLHKSGQERLGPVLTIPVG